ncbi:Poly(A) RNA polymerase protein 1 [Candida viswanathii]|uniref:polynucleotide adenylyltransferase n=1 Tax=Candida viswanathii TaxID=5486 RepID=A0A367Y3H0_9ASCO|nr:Poly(A) RNA polymerase protein 1 [Candida viswanathii]
MMGSKRKRESNVPTKPRKKKGKPLAVDVQLSANNNFEALQGHSDDDSDIEVIYEYHKPQDDIILLDSDEEENGKEETPVSEPESKKRKLDALEEDENGGETNELAKNEDFIGFGFLSTDEEESDGEASEEEDRSNTPNSQYPWIKDHDHSRQKEIADWLTMEIQDFVNYISPSSDEIITRNKVIATLKKKISAFWPGTEVHVFGSCATDLYLPGSDIDMVIVSQTGTYENASRLYQLSTFLRTNKLATDVEVIAHAKVPIIKFVDPVSRLHIDVSFERTNGIDAAKRIRRWLISTPGLRELVLVVKQFLRTRRLNNVHVGGLGGYATIIMCYHFLRLHPKLSTEAMNALDNLGVLLIEFFELYGRNFSYDDLLLALDPESEEPKYVKKLKSPLLNSARSLFAIIIQDPADPSNNITRSSYNLRDLKKAFGGAYQLLLEKCYQLNAASYRERLGALILGDIIKYTGKERNFSDDRHKVVNHALVKHDEDEEANGDESDGQNGNDKYYFSDMTDDSEEEYVPELVKPTPITKKPKDTKKLIENMLSLNNSSDDDKAAKEADEEYVPTLAKPKSNLDKEVKRDYWRQKGLDL